MSACGISGCSGCSRCYEALRTEYTQVQQAKAELEKIREWLKKEISDEEFYSGGPSLVERLTVLREVQRVIGYP